MSMYAKLFARITESSLMEEQIPVRYTFVLLLAIADPEGYVIGTDVAIARRLNMPLEDFRECLAVLMAPDPDSNSKEEDGRRVIVSDGERGYKLVNYRTYRDMKDEDERRTYMREYMRKRRAQQSKSEDVNSGKQDLTQEEAHADVPEEAPVPKEKSKGITEGSTRSLIPTTEQSKRIASLFNRRLTTAWSEKEFAAYRKIGTVEPDQLTAIEGYYAAERAKGDEGRHRRDLQTFLNNFPGELDRALAWAATRKNGVPRGTSSVTTEHPNWASWLKSKGLPYIEQCRAATYHREEFYRAQK